MIHYLGKTYPTDPFTTLELHNPLHGVTELHKIGRFPDFEALKLFRDRSGMVNI